MTGVCIPPAHAGKQEHRLPQAARFGAGKVPATCDESRDVAPPVLIVDGGSRAFVFWGLTAAFAWAVFHNGGADVPNWRLSLLAIGLISLVWWTRARGHAPELSGWLKWPLLLLPAFGVLQVVPLPLGLLNLISPARAELASGYARAIGTEMRWAPLSVAPAASLSNVLRISACVLTVMLVREICWRSHDHPWRPALPLAVIAAIQAMLGLLQYSSGEPAAHGSYVNRNHFAGLLEMALPFALLYPAVVIGRSCKRGHAPTGAALLACLAIGAAILILLGLLFSLSRMGFVASSAGILVAGAGWIACAPSARRRRQEHVRKILRLSAIAGFACAAICVLLFLAPAELVGRFGQLSFGDGVTTADREQLWRESLQLVGDYAVFGCGLGGYESAFMRYKNSAPMYTDDFAHNDYLQYFAELGAAGFAVALLGAVALIVQTLHAAGKHSSFQGRCLAVACIAAFTAVLLHSTVDFNLYIPANCLSLAWIAGIGSSVMLSSHPAPSSEVVGTIGSKTN